MRALLLTIFIFFHRNPPGASIQTETEKMIFFNPLQSIALNLQSCTALQKTHTFCEKQINQTCVLNHHNLGLDICDPKNKNGDQHNINTRLTSDRYYRQKKSEHIHVYLSLFIYIITLKSLNQHPYLLINER